MIDPRADSSSEVSNPNCLIAAIAPSVVSFKLSKDGASSVFAKASRAILVSLALIPAWASVEATSIKLLLLTPKFVASLVISSEILDNSDLLFPVTCCSLTICLSKSIKAFVPEVIALIKPYIPDVTILKAANLLTASADCFPNS